jgi:hypothetical protein
MIVTELDDIKAAVSDDKLLERATKDCVQAAPPSAARSPRPSCRSTS